MCQSWAMTGHNQSMSPSVDEFRSLFHATHPKIVAYARRRAADAAADDVVAETFLVAWRRRDEVTAMDNPLPWLYAVAGNQLRNQHRSANRHLRLVSKVADEVAADPAMTASGPNSNSQPDADPAVDLVRAGLSTLSFDDQEVLRLVAWEELTYQEAADALGCSLDAVAQRIRRAKQRLAAAIEQLGQGAPSDRHSESDRHIRGA